MTTKKDFDCIEYKRMVQAKHAVENAGLTPEQRVKRLEEWVAHSDDPLAKWWRGIKAEKGAEHTAEQ